LDGNKTFKSTSRDYNGFKSKSGITPLKRIEGADDMSNFRPIA